MRREPHVTAMHALQAGNESLFIRQLAFMVLIQHPFVIGAPTEERAREIRRRVAAKVKQFRRLDE